MTRTTIPYGVRAAEAAARIAARGYGIILQVACETAETPGLLGQIRGVTDHRAKTVRIGLRANPDMATLAETLEHEARHVDDPSWDCGARDVLGRGPAGPPNLADVERRHGVTIQNASSAVGESAGVVPSDMTSQAASGALKAPRRAEPLSARMQNELMRLCSARRRRGPDAWERIALQTGVALERRGLAEVRLARHGDHWQAVISEAGEAYLADRGITCR